MLSRFNSKSGIKRTPGLARPTNPGNIYRSSPNFAARFIIAALVVGGLLLVIFGLKSILFAGKIPPLIGLEVSSDPAGALISLNGKQVGTTTPGLVMLNEGFNKITLEKKGFASYTLELEVKKDAAAFTTQLTPSETAVSPAGTLAPLPSITKTQGAGSGNQNLEIPVYPVKAKLSRAVANLVQLPSSLPNLQILKARYLPAAPDLLELSEQVKGSGSLDIGAEGIPSGLWIYEAGSRVSRPVVIANRALTLMLHYYGFAQENASPLNSEALNRLILSAPVLSSDGRSLAVISRLLPDQNSTLSLTSASNPVIDWQTQAIWKLPLASQISPGGAWLASGGESEEHSNVQDPGTQTVKITSLMEILTILPGLKSYPGNSTDVGSAGNSLLPSRGPSFQELSWDLEDNRLLLVIKLPQENDAGSSNGNTVLVLVGTEQGNLRLATPLPLPVTVLPGTVKWSRGSKAVSFLVQESNRQVGLCTLDLAQVLAETSININNSVSQPPGNPLRYLGKLGSKGIWSDNSNNPSPSSKGSATFPPAYGSIRFNPFSWASSDGQDQKLLLGAYAKAAPAWATGSGQEFDTLYAYLPYWGGSNQAAKELEPLTLDQKQIEAGSQDRANLPEDSFPFWMTGLYGQPNLFYLSSRMAQSTGGFLGGTTYLEISLNELNLQNSPFSTVMPTTVIVQPENEVKNAPAIQNLSAISGIKVTLLRAYSDRVKLPAFDDNGSRDFEAEFNLDGTGAIVALPEARNGRNVEFWLATWG